MRRKLWKWHSWLGLIVSVPLFIIALSGSLLVFKAEIDQLLIPQIVKAENTTRLPFTELLSIVQTRLPEHEVLGWEFTDHIGDADKIYVVKLGTYDWQKSYVDPSNALILNQPVAFDFFLTDWILELHQSLLAGQTGVAIAALVSILLIILAITGIILYRRFWKNFFRLRWGKSLRLFLSDSHKMMGIIASPLFLISGFTGAWWSIEHFTDQLYSPDQSQFIVTKRYYNDQLDFDQLLKNASLNLPQFKTLYVRLPDKSFPGIHLFGYHEEQGLLRSRVGSIVSFDDQSGQITSSFSAQEASLLYQFKDSFDPLHFGYFGGLFTKVIWSVLGFVPCLMALSGFFMWRKRAAPRKK